MDNRYSKYKFSGEFIFPLNWENIEFWNELIESQNRFNPDNIIRKAVINDTEIVVRDQNGRIIPSKTYFLG